MVGEAGKVAAAARFAHAASRFLGLLPALLLASACLRAAELVAGWPDGGTARAAAACIARALTDDALGLLRYLPLLFLVSLPALLLQSKRGLVWGIGLIWSTLVLAQACLVEYFLSARVPLGADLYTYSAREIGATALAGLHIDPWLALGTAFALTGLWVALVRRSRDAHRESAPLVTIILCGIGLGMLGYGPSELPPAHAETEYARSLRLSKTPYFLDQSGDYLRRVAVRPAPLVAPPAPAATAPRPDGAPPVADAARPADPRYPFLHVEGTADVLGPVFNVDAGTPPNLVFVIVEGLGRSFSGPAAPLGSFTPFLDQLAARSLYWDNFLAPQGRTFAVLPSLFGSLPFADEGFAALGKRMPEHATLLSVLKSQGYRLRYFGGTDSAFDDERTFLERQGVDALFDRASFGPAYERSTDWGYDDAELVALALAEEDRDDRRPFIDVIQTITMHDPFQFHGIAAYRTRVEQRLDQLAIAAPDRAPYLADRDIYASILYTDDALRRYFEAAAKRASYRNTIFILTGDHRLPELPLSEWIDRYHVPLIIYSPLLKGPRRVRSISSQFDIAPSLLAFLSHGYGLRTPAAVTWLGSGLDLEPSFRNVHDIPMKQTKASLVDFASGEWLLSRDVLYRLSDGLHMERTVDADAQARAEARFREFRAANALLARSLVLAPSGTFARTGSYAERGHDALPTVPPAGDGVLAVRDVNAPERARRGELALEVAFANGAREPSGPFVPLVVMTAADGTELSESYGGATALRAGQTVTLHLPVRTDGVPGGRYFLAVYPSDPATGKRIGEGRFHIPVVIDERTTTGTEP